MAYIFDANSGETPETIARQREIAAMLMGQGNMVAPRNTLDGIGNAFAAIAGGAAAGAWNRKADAAEKAGRSSAVDTIKRALLGEAAPLSPEAGAAAPSPSDFDANNPVYNDFMGGVREGGLTNPYALAAVAATGNAESRFDPVNANRTWSDPSASGQPGTAGGIMSWRGDRLNKLYQFAASRGEQPGKISPATQAAFFMSEDPQLIASLNGAKSLPEAQTLMNNAWRFAGYNHPGAEAESRLAFAQGILPSLQGDQPALPVGASPTAGGQQPAPQMGSAGVDTLVSALSHPFVNPGERAVLTAELQRRMQAQDPMRRAQLEKLQLETEQLRNPRRGLMNAGDGRLYNQNTGEWITAPDTGDRFRQATPEEAARYGVPGGQFGPDGRFYPVNPPSGTALTVDPQTGAVTFQQGAGVKPLTEQQSKDTVYSTRARGAQPILDTNEAALASGVDNLTARMPFGNYGVSEGFQKGQQAGSEFLLSILRKDTGAAVTPDERREYGTVYLPQPGDSQAVIDQKRAARHRAIAAIEAGLPPQAILQQEKALQAGQGQAGGAQQPGAPAGGPGTSQGSVAGSGPVGAPPATAIRALREQPYRRDEFDTKYGPGAAARALGQ